MEEEKKQGQPASLDQTDGIPQKSLLPSGMKFLFVVSGVVIFLMVVTGGITLFTLFGKNLPEKSIVVSPTPLPPTPTPTSDPTRLWNVYESKRFGFHIKYPDEIVIGRETKNGDVEFWNKNDLKKDFRTVNRLLILYRGEKGKDPRGVFMNGECLNPCKERLKEVTMNNAVGIQTLGPGYPLENNYYLTDMNKTAPVVRMTVSKLNLEDADSLSLFSKMIQTFFYPESLSSGLVSITPSSSNTVVPTILPSKTQ